MSILKKISAKTVGVTENGQSFILRGRVGNYAIVKTDKGDAIKFQGMFDAMNEQTGEVFQSSTAYIPSSFGSVFAEQLKRLQDSDIKASLIFAARFEKREANNVVKTEWIMTALGEDNEVNVNSIKQELLALANEVKPVKTLAAPKAKSVAKKKGK